MKNRNHMKNRKYINFLAATGFQNLGTIPLLVTRDGTLFPFCLSFFLQYVGSSLLYQYT